MMTIIGIIAIVVGFFGTIKILNLIEKNTEVAEEETVTIKWGENFCTQDGYNN